MIIDTLNFLVDYLSYSFLTRNPSIGNPVVLGKFPTADDHLSMSQLTLTLMNIEEDKVNKEPYRQDRVRNNDGTYSFIKYNPDTKLNLFVAISYNTPAPSAGGTNPYTDGLRGISYVVQAFQNQYAFSGNDFSSLLAKITLYNTTSSSPYTAQSQGVDLGSIEVELHSQSIDQVANTWQALGGFSVPFVIYRVKMVVVSSETPLSEPSGEILEIDINTGRVN